MPYNNFGLSITDIVNYFVTGAVSASNVSAQLGGDSVIQAVMDDITYRVVGAFNYEVRSKIDVVELEQLNPDGGLRESTSTLSLGLTPVSEVRSVWSYSDKPSLKPDTSTDLSTDEYTVDLSAGTITKSRGDFSSGSYIFVTYDVDTDDEDYQLPSVAAVIKQGVVATIGPKIYSDENEWSYIKYLNTEFSKRIDYIQKAKWVPDELRKLNYWNKPNSGSTITTIPWLRG